MQSKQRVLACVSMLLMPIFFAGCTATASQSATSIPISSSGVAASSLSQSAVSASSASSQSTSDVELATAIEPFPLQLDDYLVYTNGAVVLNPADVTFWVFSFANNAENNGLTASEISTFRGLRLGSSTEEIEMHYSDIPLEIYENPEETVAVPYENYSDYIESNAFSENHTAIFSLYVLDGVLIYEPYIIELALDTNQYSKAHNIIRYDLTLQIQLGQVADIVLSVNDMSPYPNTHLTPSQFTSEGKYTVGIYSLGVSATALRVPIGVQNHLDEPVIVRCYYTEINGQATRNPGHFELTLDPHGYGEQTLLILNEDIRPTDIESLESIGIALQFYSPNGQLLFESEGIELPVFSNV